MAALGVPDVGAFEFGGVATILANISTRAFVQTGDNVMIGGFIVQGTQPKRVILRAIGPELSSIWSSKCNGRSNIGAAQWHRGFDCHK